jgi:hypothetical protein
MRPKKIRWIKCLPGERCFRPLCRPLNKLEGVYRCSAGRYFGDGDAFLFLQRGVPIIFLGFCGYHLRGRGFNIKLDNAPAEFIISLDRRYLNRIN